MMIRRGYNYTPLGSLKVLRTINQLYKEKKEKSERILEKIDDFDFLLDLSVKK